MILLIFGICILMVIGGSILYDKFDTDTYCNLAILGGALGFVSFSLVQAQIEVYTENNKTIRDLRDKQIKGNVYRWWLYFGGGNT